MINVLVVDDSAVVRQVLTEQIKTIGGVKLMGTARDPIYAMRMMEQQWPDVIILDIEMPRMDGITFLKKLMSERPTPVIICSTLTERGAEVTMQAMSLGAVDIITKPKTGLKGFLQDSESQLSMAIKGAAQACTSHMRRPTSNLSTKQVAKKISADAILTSSTTRPMTETTDRVVAIGTSTGGTQALEVVLSQLPRTCPGIVVVQHMPESFTAAFAERLNQVCEVTVQEAQTHDRVIPGQVLIANGGKHLLVRRSGAQYRVELKDGPVVSRHRPSVDVLFRSVANTAGPNALGIIMTGMGDDGAKGMLEMHKAGARTLAQNEDSCVVYGMPKEAVKLGGVDREVDLGDIPNQIVAHA